MGYGKAEKNVTPRGFELADVSALPANDLQQSQQPGAAKSGAISIETLLAMLATLSPADRARLAALLTGEANAQEEK